MPEFVIYLLKAAASVLASIGVAIVVALTDPQVDELILLLRQGLEAFSDAVKTVWFTLSPVLLGYLAYRQAINRKALDENTEVSKQAFKEANGLNQKIADSTQAVQAVVSHMTNSPQRVVVENTVDNPVPTNEV
jgi:hypothetical protein